MIEDAVIGVTAGHAGGLRLMMGVDHGAGHEALLEVDADIVVADLAALMTNRP